VLDAGGGPGRETPSLLRDKAGWAQPGQVWARSRRWVGQAKTTGRCHSLFHAPPCCC
jgi:hypothetical protein